MGQINISSLPMVFLLSFKIKVIVFSLIPQVSCTELLPKPLSVSALFTIDVQDVNEAPYNLTISSKTVKENGFPWDIVGVLSVLDPDLLVR